MPSELGSSPRVRGLLSGVFAEGQREGIIPARAGFTQLIIVWHDLTQDHPRACGVYWGPYLDAHDGVRIIPARAGFTPSPCRTRTRRRDHPRACGVYEGLTWALAAAAGSSPRVRGLPDAEGSQVITARIIPARAGFTDITFLETEGK